MQHLRVLYGGLQHLDCSSWMQACEGAAGNDAGAFPGLAGSGGLPCAAVNQVACLVAALVELLAEAVGARAFVASAIRWHPLNCNLIILSPLMRKLYHRIS